MLYLYNQQFYHIFANNTETELPYCRFSLAVPEMSSGATGEDIFLLVNLYSIMNIHLNEG